MLWRKVLPGIVGGLWGFSLVLGSVAQANWKEDWEKTLQAAKKEGQLMVYVYRFGPVLDVFQKKFPEIKVVYVSAPGSQLVAREMAERRAGKFLVDVHSSGANGVFNTLYKGKALDPIKPTFILPEVLDESRWYGGKHAYVDGEEKYIFAYLANAGSGGQLAYNSQMVNPKEFKAYHDLLNPKWKGKIVALDPRNTGLGATMQFFYYNPELGPKFIRRLFGEMDVTLSRDFRQMTDWLAMGKFALCLGCTKIVQAAKSQGLPVDELTVDWKEGASLSTGGGSLSLLNRAPHPNAAKVFINWFLSREGQIALQKYGDVSDPQNSRRMDIVAAKGQKSP
jgi:iron(III) transport system substrate-binding protein